MKKSIWVLLMATALGLVGLTGCSEEEMTQADGIVEDMMDDHYYSVEAYGMDEAILRLTTVDESGEVMTEEVGSQGFAGDAGGTIAQMMEEWNITEIEAVCGEYALLGWRAYENVVEVEDGFETYTMQELYDGKIFTTEEMLHQELPDTDVYFMTVWDLTCGECKEQKECEVYYVDDDCYFVCEDCYASFANRMGWE